MIYDFILSYLLIGCLAVAIMHHGLVFLDSEVNFWEAFALVTLWPFTWGFAFYHFIAELLKD